MNDTIISSDKNNVNNRQDFLKSINKLKAVIDLLSQSSQDDRILSPETMPNISILMREELDRMEKMLQKMLQNISS
ncbi:MAG: hypothetical protein JXB88_26175 [Spirochaetales bacterium]|nr:hypothetical protein [Spirochaetales bacterium]